MDRRNFIKVVSVGSLAIATSPIIKAADSGILPEELPETNIKDAIAIPRTKNSMPGRYPGKVALCKRMDSVVQGEIVESVAYDMLAASMLSLTGRRKLSRAWREFVSPKDIIGLKVNPIGGKLLSTSHAVVKSIIRQLEESGISRSNIIIWDRREEELHDAGFNSDNYPGIKILGTEYCDENGSFYGSDGKLLSEGRIDRNWYFYADVEEKYDAYTIPYMVNEGKYSYYSKICTQEVTKIINVPILKNAGSAITCCMKNLGFGVITNTARLHKQFWHHTSAYVCAFPPVRDKVVLNIADALKGCFDGGPGANPQFICEYNSILVGSDPVAVDRVGHDIVINKRIQEGIQSKDRENSTTFLELARDLKLGVSDIEKIEIINVK
ncbi:MAG: DUF362 domain-containing protein [Bacteroidales bacterium]|nr:DUF362 domain-containing protein [Bacteroidales bacterium]